MSVPDATVAAVLAHAAAQPPLLGEGRLVCIDGPAGSGKSTLATALAEATADAIERVAAAIRQPGGEQAVQLKVAERAVDAFSKVAADSNTTLIVPGNMTETAALIASAMRMVQAGKPAPPI